MDWLVEGLVDQPGYLPKHMFGCRACYYNGLLTLILAEKDEPWNGLMVATDKERQTALIRDFPALRPHEILPKWLYLSQDELVELIIQEDSRIGVVPKSKKLS
jgi:hypothetical protein